MDKIKQLVELFAFHKKGFLTLYITQNERSKVYRVYFTSWIK